ncbi:MAG: hypothetical protein ABIS92_01590 [Polyangia bacterium]
MTSSRALTSIVFLLSVAGAAVMTASPCLSGVALAAPVVSGGAGASGATSATPARPALPAARSVDAILTDVVAAVGGAAALGKHRSLHTKMEITFKGLGITGTAEHYGAVGDKALTITEIPNLASTREGSDGTHHWSEDPINGLRLLMGVEAEQARVEAAWNAELRMKSLFQKVEANNDRADDGTLLECLTLTPKLGPLLINCFDAQTHLMTLQKGVRSGPQGDMPFTARLSDWRAVGDVKMAYATDMQVGPLAFMGRVTSIEVDVPTPATLFAMPAGGSKARKQTSKQTSKPAKGDGSAKPAKR